MRAGILTLGIALLLIGVTVSGFGYSYTKHAVVTQRDVELHESYKLAFVVGIVLALVGAVFEAIGFTGSQTGGYSSADDLRSDDTTRNGPQGTWGP